jgi:Mg-chelatase subunit ChlD/MoxR-like ATPase
MIFPWSAVVGQDSLKHALILCAIDRAIGGVLVHGPRGVAKTTLARALAELVPGGFVELPLGATEERVTGTLNLELALQAGRVEFAPGLLARAHDGVLYVDEINLLPDALVDLLLDAAASGRNVVERDGVSHAHPARFVLVGSMNPEEGELRPQLIDRFGLSAAAAAKITPPERAQIVTRRLAFDRDPESFRAGYAAQQATLIERCRRARARCAEIALEGPALERVTQRCYAAGVEGVRADMAMLRAARANAAWHERSQITIEDVDAVAELALAHRRPEGSDGGPDGGGGGSSAASGRGAAHGSGARVGGAGLTSRDGPASVASEPADAPKRHRASNVADRVGGDGPIRDSEFADAADDAWGDASRTDGLAPGADQGGRDGKGRTSGIGVRGAMPGRPVRAAAATELPRWLTNARGRRPGKSHRGLAQLKAATGKRARGEAEAGAIDWFATLRALLSEVQPEIGPLTTLHDESPARTQKASRRPTRSHLRYRSRRSPAAQLWILAIDCSSSMLRSGGLSVAKGVANAFEQGARRSGARLAVISFRGTGATLEVDSTPGRAVLPRAIAALGGGGGTPLREALLAAAALCRQPRWSTPGVFKRLCLLTDGRVRSPGASFAALPPDLHRVVVDCERGRVKLGRAQPLATALCAQYWRADTVLA